MNRLIAAFVLSLTGALTASPVLADVPSLQVAPLSYQGTLKPGTVESGYVDVSNPSDETVLINSDVQGFRQIDSRGDLAFYTDPDLSSAITVGLNNFNLGPRQAVRVVFDIDPSKLPLGGVYATIFFRTVPTAQNSNNSYVLQSANVGTLLILTNGKVGPYQGQISGLSMKFLQLGSGLLGSLGYKNTEAELHSAGFKPNLKTAILPWGHPTTMSTGLVLPGVTRDFSFNRPGSYFGLIPVTLTDSQTGAHATAWILADTGYYQVGVPVGIVVLLVIYFAIARRRNRPKKPITSQKPMDGISRIPVPEPAPVADTSPEPDHEPEVIEVPPASSALEELRAAELEKDTDLDLPQSLPAPKSTKVKVQAEPKPKPKSSNKTKSKTKPKKPKS